jgi:hypothetical protein
MTPAPEHPPYPPAERLDLVEDLHGMPVADPYRWLEAADDPRTVDWSTAQDDLFREHAAGWPGREALAGRLAELLGAGVVGVPVWRGDRRFFIRRAGDQEHAVLLVAEPGPDGRETERVLVDPIAIDPEAAISRDAGIPDEAQGCHLSMIDGYAVSGHVPIGTVKKLLTERPDIKGVTLPGMPMGSPGMSGTKEGPFEMLKIRQSGGVGGVYARE